VGRDGNGYRFDSSQADTEIFLQKGLDRKIAWHPTGKSDEALQQIRLSPNSCGFVLEVSLACARIQEREEYRVRAFPEFSSPHPEKTDHSLNRLFSAFLNVSATNPELDCGAMARDSRSEGSTGVLNAAADFKIPR
jgi:hypothetical protein